MAGWFMPEKMPFAPVRLFCFPFAGGGASAYRSWLKEPLFGVVPVQLPGRENRMREKPLRSMEDVVTQVTDAVMPWTKQPYAFFGHSLGARIAFEVARQLRRRGGLPPVHLFVSGSRSPEIPEPFPLHELNDDDFITALARYGGTPGSLLENRELMKLFLPMLRADFLVDETYEFKEENPLSIPVTAFYGTDDREANRQEMQGWQRHTDREFQMIEVPGGHFFIQQETAFLLGRIRQALGV